MKQHITRLVDDEGAVSPVIGVILMVAITVILAAVIGTFVLGLGGQVSQTAPQASISVTTVDATNNEVTLKHGGSDSLTAADTNVKVEGETWDYTLDTSGEAKFSTADTITIHTDGAGAGNTTTWITGWAEGNWDGHSSETFSSGDDLTITFIDDPSGQVIADKEVAA